MSSNGVDLGQSPIRVGAFVDGKYTVVQGTKEVKLNDQKNENLSSELKEIFNDVNEVAESKFGRSLSGETAVVVPNSTRFEQRELVRKVGSGIINGRISVLSERAAVAGAYADIVKPLENKRLAVVSVTGGVVDVSIISVEPGLQIEFLAKARETQPEPVGPEEQIAVFSRLKEKELKVDEIEIVFVGKAFESETLKDAAKENFPDASVWSPEKVVGPDELAAYGAGALAFLELAGSIYSSSLVLKDDWDDYDEPQADGKADDQDDDGEED